MAVNTIDKLQFLSFISSIGPVLQSLFTLVASWEMRMAPRGLFLVEEITNIVHVGTQLVSFYAHMPSVFRCKATKIMKPTTGHSASSVLL